MPSRGEEPYCDSPQRHSTHRQFDFDRKHNSHLTNLVVSTTPRRYFIVHHIEKGSHVCISPQIISPSKYPLKGTYNASSMI